MTALRDPGQRERLVVHRPETARLHECCLDGVLVELPGPQLGAELGFRLRALPGAAEDERDGLAHLLGDVSPDRRDRALATPPAERSRDRSIRVIGSPTRLIAGVGGAVRPIAHGGLDGPQDGLRVRRQLGGAHSSSASTAASSPVMSVGTRPSCSVTRL